MLDVLPEKAHYIVTTGLENKQAIENAVSRLGVCPKQVPHLNYANKDEILLFSRREVAWIRYLHWQHLKEHEIECSCN